MMSPGMSKHPEHEVTTERMDERVEVYLDGELIAESNSAIKLFEVGHEPVIYIPKNDLKGIDLEKFDDYVCPYKGHAELYNIKQDGFVIEDGAWSYDRPFDELDELKGRVAFYPDKVDEIRVIG